jgi:hypothetical protein
MRKRTAWLAAATALAATTAIAACGSTSPTHSSSASASGGVSSNSNQAQIHNQSVAFSRCVRTHGVSNFPDPPTNGGYGLKSFAQQSNGRTMSINGVSVSAPAFRSAMVHCNRYLPEGPPATSAGLAYSRAAAVRYGRCMRSHRINIPDPTVQAGPGGHGIGVRVDIPTGMTQNSPAFVNADQYCEHASGFGSPPPGA